MNTQNKVFEKLFSDEKVELGSHKIELADAQQILSKIDKLFETAKKVNETMNTKFNVYKAAFRDYSKGIQQAKQDSILIEGEIESFIEALRAMGIPQNEASKISGLQKSIDKLNNLTGYINQLDTAVKEVFKYPIK